MRRPCPIGWTAQLDRYLDCLKQSEVSPTDEFFCGLITTEKLCHLTDKELLLSDPTNLVSLWEPKTLNIIEHMKRQIQDISLDRLNRLEKGICPTPSRLRTCGIRMANFISSPKLWQIGKFAIRS